MQLGCWLSSFFPKKRSKKWDKNLRRNPATAIVIWNLLAVLTLWIFFYCQLIIHFPWFFLEQFTTLKSSIKTTRNPTRWVHTVDLIFFFRIFDDQIPFKDPFTVFFSSKKSPKKISFRKWVEYVASHSLLPQNLGSGWVGKNSVGGDVWFFNGKSPDFPKR